MSWLLMLWSYRRAIGASLVVLAVSYAAWDYVHDRYRAGFEAGTAAVQARWDADIVARDATVAQLTRERAERDEAIRAENREVIHEYQKQVSNIVSDRDGLARRLRDNEVRLRALSEAADKRGITGAATQPEGERGIDEALDAYDRACRQDAAQLEALIKQISEQLDT